MSSGNIILAFDVYGTLLSTDSIAEKLATYFGDAKAQTIATTWRKYQLEYTWRLSSMGLYEDFTQITRRSLQHTVMESGLSLDDAQTKDLMSAYDQLRMFSDVAACLESLKAKEGITIVLFSNGTHDMIHNSMMRSPDFSSYAPLVGSIVSVDEVKKFKPAPETYYHLAERMGKDHKTAGDMGRIWLVSSNPFDVVGARAVGMKAVWVDRAGNGWQDRLLHQEDRLPTAIVNSLDQVTDVVTGK